MDTRKKRTTWILVFIFLLILGSLFFFTTRYLTLRVQANITPPLILIHNPVDGDEVFLQEGTFLNATAESEAGISRIELWVDGEFITAQQTAQSAGLSPMLLRTFWQPTGIGMHEIIVRAYDVNKVEASVSVVVQVSGETSQQGPPVDPTGIIAAGPDGSVDEITPPEGEEEIDSPAAPESSSGSSGGDAGPSTEPGDSPGPSESAADYTPPEPAEAPAPEEEAPSALFPALEFRFLQLFQFAGEDEEEDALSEDADGSLTILKLEALGLETNPGLEGVHCYIGLGGRTPAWYPDADEDQSTDENFLPTGGNQWNVADFLAEGSGVVTAWPADEALPIEINCIGTSNGGTQAVDLGTANISAPPEEWDGITRQMVAAGEGYFTLSYRISHEEMVPKGLDHEIAVPFNLHIDERRQELQWEWTPGEGGEEIDGFLIFINDNLVFRTDETARAVRIPYVWFAPPCDVTYEFTVRAYQRPYPEGSYSVNAAPVSLPLSEEPRTDCNPEFVISFETLVTGDLGQDDIDNNWAHMVEPTHGIFFANEKEVEFFNTTLHPNHTYNLNDLIGENGGGMSRFVYELEEDENLRIGFDIIDYDDGNNEILCTNLLFHDYRYSDLMGYGYFEDTLYSYGDDTHKCVVHYTIRPVEGAAFGTDNPSFMPLPWIDVTRMWVNLSTQQVHLEIKNTGSAAWTNHNLQIGIAQKDDDTVTPAFQGEIALEVGESTMITTNYETDHLQGLCAMVDMNNEVLELYENTGAYADHATLRYCMPRPDLRIEEIDFNVDESTLYLLVRNMGDNDSALGRNQVNLKNIGLRIDSVRDGDSFYTPLDIFPDQVLARTDSAWIEWTLTPAARQKLIDGYTITIDPDNRYIESDETNNSLTIGGGEYLRITWSALHLRWYPRNLFQDCHNEYTWLDHEEDVWVDVFARTDSSSQLLASWHLETNVSFEETFGFAIGSYQTDAYVHAEESLAVEIRGEHEGSSMGSSTGWFYNFQDWGISETIQEEWSCNPNGMGSGITAYPPDSHQRVCGGWTVYVEICRVEQDND